MSSESRFGTWWDEAGQLLDGDLTTRQVAEQVWRAAKIASAESCLKEADRVKARKDDRMKAVGAAPALDNYDDGCFDTAKTCAELIYPSSETAAPGGSA